MKRNTKKKEAPTPAKKPSTPTNTSKKTFSNKWIVLAIIVLLLSLAVYCFRGENPKQEEDTIIEDVSQIPGKVLIYL